MDELPQEVTIQYAGILGTDNGRHKLRVVTDDVGGSLDWHVVVLMLAGWEASVGVQAEIQIAQELGKPIAYLAPEAPTLARAAEETRR